MFGNVSSDVMNATAGSGIVIPKVVEGLVIAIGILSVIFNGILLLVMILNSKQVFASLGSYFIANLAVADFITGLNSIVWGINGFHPLNPTVHKILLCVFWTTVQVSFFTIFVMSTERLVAIVFPFRAALLMSKKKTMLYCGMVWLISLVWAGLSNIDDRTVWFVLIVAFEVVIIASVIEYVFIFRQLRVLWQHSKKRVMYTHQGSPSKAASDLQQEYQVTIVVVTLTMILVFTVFPYMIATQIFLSCQMFRPSCTGLDGLQAFMWYYFPIELLNFVINPIVYAWRLPKYRNAFLVTFGLQRNQDGRRSCSSNGSPKTTRSICPNGKEMTVLVN